jgi:cyclic pyranopterin phosphate synthase
MAVKKTADIIPLYHTILITKCGVEFECDSEKNEVKAICTVKTDGKTGVETEALTGYQQLYLQYMTCAKQ